VSGSEEPDLAAMEADVRYLHRALWRGRWFVAITTTFCALGGLAYAAFAEEWFRAEVVLVQSDSKAMASPLAQLGGLASLAGINIGGSSGSAQVPLAVLRSRDFVRSFIEDEGLLHAVLFEKWDANTEQWLEQDPRRQPDIRDAVDRFDRSIRGVTEDIKKGTVRLSVTWVDPDVAATWANLLVSRLNARLREQAITEAEANIRYLQREMSATAVASLQQSIGKVLESEMQKLMLARGAEQFSFKVIDPAAPPKVRFKPKRMLVVACASVAGAFLSLMLVMLRAAFANAGAVRNIRSAAET
jgi:uncharacterized protein involved in exopolysaccharide biosynthesis